MRAPTGGTSAGFSFTACQNRPRRPTWSLSGTPWTNPRGASPRRWATSAPATTFSRCTTFSPPASSLPPTGSFSPASRRGSPTRPWYWKSSIQSRCGTLPRKHRESEGDHHERAPPVIGDTRVLPPSDSLHYPAARHADSRPDALAVDGPCGRLSYGQLRDRAWLLAAELADLVVWPGDRLAVGCGDP